MRSDYVEELSDAVELGFQVAFVRSVTGGRTGNVSDRRAQGEVLRPGGGTNRIRLHEPERVDGVQQGERREEAARDCELPEMIATRPRQSLPAVVVARSRAAPIRPDR
jgi:hypothetical protein